MGLPKTYRATVRFGTATDTLDPEGTVVAQADPGPGAPVGLAEALAVFLGEREQLPPAYSALKVGGRRAYALARAGREPTLAPRRVVVHAIELLDARWPDAEIEVTCGEGVYVRAMARDLGDALGLPAHLSALRRTAIGPFRAGDGCAPEEATPQHVRPMLEVVRAAGVPEVAVGLEEARRFCAGSAVPAAAADGPVAVTTGEGVLVGLGDACGGTARPRTVFAAARRALA